MTPKSSTCPECSGVHSNLNMLTAMLERFDKEQREKWTAQDKRNRTLFGKLEGVKEELKDNRLNDVTELAELKDLLKDILKVEIDNAKKRLGWIAFSTCLSGSLIFSIIQYLMK